MRLSPLEYKKQLVRKHDAEPEVLECGVCGKAMDRVSTSIGVQPPFDRLDHFECAYLSVHWHRQLMQLRRDYAATKDASVRRVIEGDIAEMLAICNCPPDAAAHATKAVTRKPVNTPISDVLLVGDDILVLAQAERILEKHKAVVSRDQLTDAAGEPLYCWYVTDANGVMQLQDGLEDEAKVTAALMLYLWERGVEISFARDLACSYMDVRLGRSVHKERKPPDVGS